MNTEKPTITNDFPLAGKYVFPEKVHGIEISYNSRDAFKNGELDPEDIYPHVHFEFRGKYASSTGYRSHFTHAIHVAQNGVEFVGVELAKARYAETHKIIDQREAYKKQKELEASQLELF